MVVPVADGTYSYRIPPDLLNTATAGMRVLVPFGHRRTTGFIVDVGPDASAQATKNIECLLDLEPVFDSGMLAFTHWMADYYLCAWGEVLKAALPAGITLDEKAHWVLEHPPEPAEWKLFFESYPAARKLIDVLKTRPLSASALKSRHRLTSRSHEIKRLTQAGVIAFRPILKSPRVSAKTDAVLHLSARAREQFGTELFTHIRTRNGQLLLREISEAGPDGAMRSVLLKGANSARRTALGKLIAEGWIELSVQEISRWDPRAERVPDTTAPIHLTPEQENALSAIREQLDLAKFKTFLLHGVTGSGKTQVYIEAIRRVLEMGKTALVLVPEIALTPFLWGRFQQAFGDQVAIQHSGQSPVVRYDLWRDIRAGRYPVVVGARSAVFAPLKNTGIIVVDEEHESSFKQAETPPRYHARDAAVVRARMENAVALLGSATPSVETAYHAKHSRYHLLELPERVGGAVHPEIHIEPLAAPDPKPPEKKKSKDDTEEEVPPAPPLLTDRLQRELQAVLDRGKQAILLQNRRGFAPFVICRACGFIAECDHCSVSLTYHRRGRILRCHYCDHREEAPDKCIQCGSPDLILHGVGTQRLEEELAVCFPDARLLRMDSDSVARPGAHGKMITAFANHEYDILLGTQMIAKGLDFSDVELAAVIQADTELFHPDFRATERGAGLILQLAGRAGRRQQPGKVIVQSAATDHPALKVVLSGNWNELVDEELKHRRRANFPPYARLVLVRAVGSDESSVARAMMRLKKLLRDANGIEILGPAPAVLVKLRNKFRYQLIARTARSQDASGTRLRAAVRSALTAYRQSRTEASVSLEIDVDPQSIA